VDDRIILRLDLDSSSVDSGLDQIKNKTESAFGSDQSSALDASIQKLNESIAVLNQSLAQANQTSDEFNQTLAKTNLEVQRSTNNSIGLVDALKNTGGAVVATHRGMSRLEQTLRDLPNDIRAAIDNFLKLSNMLRLLIELTDLKRYDLFNNLTGQLEKMNKAIIENRDQIERKLEIYTKLFNLRMQAKEFFSDLGDGAKNTASVFGVGTVAAVAYNTYLTKSFSQGVAQTAASMTKMAGSVTQAASAMSGQALSAAIGFIPVLKMLREDAAMVGAVFFGNTKTIFSFTDFIIGLSAKMFSLAGILGLTTGQMAAFGTGALAAAAVVTGLLGLAIGKLIFGIADLVKQVGTDLVSAFQRSYNVFLNFRKESLAFTETLKAFNSELDGAVGTAEDWASTINRVSTSLNFSQTELRKASTEIISVGSRLGLTRKQMEQLLDVSATYARITGKDLFQTTVNFASALNGNSQAVLAYGVKLSEASNAQFALKSGLQESFGQLSEGQKTQVRFNNLIGQYSTVAGVAATISNDWFQQGEKLKVTLENVNQQVGLGAAYVEDLNLAAGLLNKILSALPEGLLRASGLIGAFGARVLQAVGAFIALSFKIFLVYRGFQLLDALLKTQSFAVLATKTIPGLNKSLTELLKNLGATNVNLKGLPATLSTIGSLFTQNKKSILGFLLGIGEVKKGSSLLGLAMSKLGGIMSGVFSVLRVGFSILAPFVLKAIALKAVLFGLYKVFEVIQRETQVFTLLGESFKALFDTVMVAVTDSSGIFKPILDGIKTAFSTTFGFIVFVVAKTLGTLIDVAARTAGVFSNKVAAPLKQASQNLDQLSNSLQVAGFNFSALGDRAIASMGEVEKFKFDDFEKLNELLKSLKDETTTDIAKIAEEQRTRLALINDALRGEVLAVQNAEIAKQQIRAVAAQKTQDILTGLFSSFEEQNNQRLVNEFNNRQRIINDAFNNSLITEVAYQNLSKQNTDAYNKAMDALYKNNSNNIVSEQQRIMEAYDLSAEQAQLAMDITQRVTEAKTNLVVGSLERLGASVVNGGAAWGDFKSFVLNILGDFAIQVGTLVLGIGAAAEALALALKTLNPVTAFIAGAALIAIGGGLKALAGSRPGGGVVSSAPTVATPGGVGVGVVQSPELAPRADAERSGVGQSVVINIEGSLFNTEETGRTMIDLITKEFDKTGAQIRRRGFA
jgi:hypothetical protein